MAKRPTGRPKAHNPRDVRVTIRLVEEDADFLFRTLREEESLAERLRRCIDTDRRYTPVDPFSDKRPDTKEAQIQRARRAARRANAAPQPTLEAQIGQALQAAGEDLATDAAAPVG